MHLEGMVKLMDPAVFSMSNLRHVVDRMVSGFFYTKPHSPHCAQGDTVVSCRVSYKGPSRLGFYIRRA